ncbi:MAG: NfeD family protein [Planctomycetota bacterium]|nr:NfeD family protein [Planctomycetota bacterium]MDP7252261.1 NfeD family protein [Planctomycetota bacterium]
MSLFMCAFVLLHAEHQAILIPISEAVYAPVIDQTKRALKDAQARGIELVFIEINISDGEPIHGKDIAEAIQEAADLKVVAYIQDKGYAAGAIIAMASSEIIMGRRSTIGNAGIFGGNEKDLSPLRATLSSYARQRGFSRRLAEAMADPDLQVMEVRTPAGIRYYTDAELKSLPPGQLEKTTVERTVVEKNKILTLDAEDALAIGLAKKIVSNREQLFGLYQLSEGDVEIVGQVQPHKPKKVKPENHAPELAPAAPPAGVPGKKVAIIPIRDKGNMVDNVQVGFIRRKILAAKKAKVDHIVIAIDTWGGRVDSADKIADFIGGADPIPTVALVTHKAISAGAWIAVACDKIYMLEGTNIGSTLPIHLGGSPTGRKVISGVKGKMKALAEKNGLPYRLIEPMVDPELELVECRIDGERKLYYRDEIPQAKARAEQERRHFEEVTILCATGDIYNLAASDAEKHGLSTKTLKKEEDLWKELGLDRPDVTRYTMSSPEKFARFVSSPYVCGPLLAIGFITLLIEFITPGFGVAGFTGVLCLSMALWSQYMVENANALEILLFMLGFALVAIELLALPGFGVIGFLGGTLILVSLVLAYIPEGQVFDYGEFPSNPDDINRALTTFGVMLFVMVGGFFILRRSLTLAGVMNRIAVTSEISTDVPGAPSEDTRMMLLGKSGTAMTPLRPSGTADIDGKILDVTSDGEFIDSKSPIEVIRIEGNKFVVKPMDAEDA